MTAIGVVAHEGKSWAGGPDALRGALAHAGHDAVPWRGVRRSKDAPAKVRKLLAEGIDRLLVWGGDGTVRRVVDTLVREGADEVSVGVLPAGTANLLAHGLGIPLDLDGAVRTALGGHVRRVDVGRVNGEHFLVMAGTGFDAHMIRDADDGLKDRLGRLSYVVTGARNLGRDASRLDVRVDGTPWFSGRASCVLVANIGTILGGIPAFPRASCTDGVLDVGVVRAETRLQWLRVLSAAAAGRADRSPLVEATTGTRIEITLEHRLPWELDGGARSRSDHLKARVIPQGIGICVPA